MNENTTTRFLTAAGCNAQMELPLQSLVRDIIDAATEHANLIGIGYSKLITRGDAWVLSRLSIELTTPPKVGEHYSLVTWIESFNRHFSGRNFEITGSNGSTIGYVRSVWVAINIDSRKPADLTSYINVEALLNNRPCPIAPQAKLKAPDSLSDKQCDKYSYTVAVSDIDSNRHLTTARYVELIVNCLPLETYDSMFVSRFDIAFMRECKFGETVQVAYTFDGAGLTAAIHDADSGLSCLAKMVLTHRNRD